MALFNSDFEAFVYIFIIAIVLVILNRFVSFILNRFKKIPAKYVISIKFVLQIITVLIVVFLVIEGVPSFGEIDPTYQAILTGSISTAIAFASSGIFSNFVSGIMLLILRPFEVGDLVKIKGDKGIVRSLKLTRTVIETFDYILIEKSNSEVISSPVVNYTIKLSKIKTLDQLKSKIQTPTEKGLIEMKAISYEDEEEYENELNQLFDRFSRKKDANLYIYTYRMAFPYMKFRIMMEEVNDICKKYQQDKIFRLRPRFHVIGFGVKIIVKFSLLAFDSERIFNYQSDLTHDIYKVILKYS